MNPFTQNASPEHYALTKARLIQVPHIPAGILRAVDPRGLYRLYTLLVSQISAIVLGINNALQLPLVEFVAFSPFPKMEVFISAFEVKAYGIKNTQLLYGFNKEKRQLQHPCYFPKQSKLRVEIDLGGIAPESKAQF